jgi:hypothetical protein
MLYAREELLYRKWLLALKHNSVLRPRRSGTSDGSGSGNGGGLLGASVVYVWGRHVSLLSSKLAKALAKRSNGAPSSSSSSGSGSVHLTVPLLVSMLTDSHAISAHRAMNELLEVSNNIVTSTRVTGAQMAALLASPERADVGIIQIDIVLRLISLSVQASHSTSISGSGGGSRCDKIGSALEELVAAMVHTCVRCLIELPAAARLELALLHSSLTGADSEDAQCASQLIDHYTDVYNARASSPAATGGAGGGGDAAAPIGLLMAATDRILPNGGTASINERPWSQWDDVDGPGRAAGRGGSSANLLVEVETNVVTTGATATSNRGVSLYTLLHMGVELATKRRLLQLAVDVPLWSLNGDNSLHLRQQVRPWTLYVSVQRVPEHSASSGVGKGTTSSDATLSLAFYPMAPGSGSGSGDGSGGYNYPPGGGEPPVVATSLGLNHFQSSRQKAVFLFEVIAQEMEAHAYVFCHTIGLLSFLVCDVSLSLSLSLSYPSIAPCLHSLTPNNV